MSLDQNLFTLNVLPKIDDLSVIDLVDPSGTVHYRKQRVPGTAYTVNVYDPVTDALLITATAPSPTSKHKTLQLYNPEAIVELKYTGTLSFKWGLKWEDHEFEWRREECFMLRKPDPAVLVAVTKEPSGRLKTTSVQILDYNLNRFDIDDRKGLEIVLLTALLTFHDMNEAYHAPRTDDASTTTSNTPAAAATLGGLLNFSLGSRRPSGADLTGSTSRTPSGNAVTDTRDVTPPTIPPRPSPRTGVKLVTEMQMMRTLQGEGEANEVEVSEEGTAEDYAQFAHTLLKDEAMLFITIRSKSPAEVPKVLHVVEETKRLRHKTLTGDDEELHQYVSYEHTSALKGPRRINLNDPDPKSKGRQSAYFPPTSLLIHLSKIDMPELRPKAEVKDPGPDLGWIAKEGSFSGSVPVRYVDGGIGGESSKAKSRGKESKLSSSPVRDRKEVVRERKRIEKEQTKAEKDRSQKVPPSAYHISEHQSVPYRESPPPNQWDNPTTHAAPPSFPVQPSMLQPVMRPYPTTSWSSTSHPFSPQFAQHGSYSTGGNVWSQGRR